MAMKETGDPREYEAFVREIDESRYAIEKDMVPRGVIPKRRGMSLSKSIAMEGVFPFPDFTPRLLASLVASSTAACTSGVVTVTATAHGIVATNVDGLQFYYPGSPSLAAGWYSGFARTSADAVTFLAPNAADFTSESINAGAAFTDEVTVSSITLPANTIQAGSLISVRLSRYTDSVSAAKNTLLKHTTRTVVGHSSNSGNGVIVLSCYAVKPTLLTGSGVDGTVGTGAYTSAIDTAVDNTFSVVGKLAAAGGFIAIAFCSMRIE